MDGWMGGVRTEVWQCAEGGVGIAGMLGALSVVGEVVIGMVIVLVVVSARVGAVVMATAITRVWYVR